MNFDWITHPLAIYGVLSALGGAALHLVISTRIEMRGQEKRYLDENHRLLEAVAALEAKVGQISLEVQQSVLLPAAYTPFTGLNVHKRAEALRMYRRGSDSHSVSTVLGLSAAEVILLEKVYHLQSGRAAA